MVRIGQLLRRWMNWNEAVDERKLPFERRRRDLAFYEPAAISGHCGALLPRPARTNHDRRRGNSTPIVLAQAERLVRGCERNTKHGLFPQRDTPRNMYPGQIVLEEALSRIHEISAVRQSVEAWQSQLHHDCR